MSWPYIILIGIGLIIGLFILYVLVIIFLPVLPVVKLPFPSQKGEPESLSPPSRSTVYFKVGNTSLEGYLYLPTDISKPVACIVMSHGFGGTKALMLEKYALEFVKAGMAVLTYDYRHFGNSEGLPRQLFSIKKQLEDLEAAIAFARSRKEIDQEKIALWGTSAAGGYGLNIAAIDKGIACIAGQCPALDAEADSKFALKRDGLKFFLKLIPHAQRDKGRSRFGLSPHKVPIVGLPGSIAIINAPGAYEGYAQLTAETDFVNEVCARVLLMPNNQYSPVNFAQQVDCPVLLQICEKDNLVSPDSYKKPAALLGKKAKVILYPISHFDIYNGEHFELAVRDQISFFTTHLNP